MRLWLSRSHRGAAVTVPAVALLALCSGCGAKAPAAATRVKSPTRSAHAATPTAGPPSANASSLAHVLPPGGPIALTFDDGPSPTWTPQILAVLKAYHIHATFFEIGKEVDAYPRISREVLAAGMVIGNHTEHHLDLLKVSAKVVTAEIGEAEVDIQRVTGEHAVYFRFPYGAITPTARTVATKLGLKVVEWDVDTEDWKKPEANWIVRHVIDLVRPGDIILMHDGGGNRSRTVAALRAIITRLEAHSYTFVMLDQLRK